MDVDRVGVLGRVDDLPLLRGPDPGQLTHPEALPAGVRHRAGDRGAGPVAQALPLGVVEEGLDRPVAVGVGHVGEGLLLEQHHLPPHRHLDTGGDRAFVWVGQPDDGRFLVLAAAQRPPARGVEGLVLARQRQHHPELHELAVQIGVGRVTAREGEGGRVRQRQGPALEAGEVDDEVGPLGRREEQLRRVRIGRVVELDRSVEQSAVGPDLPEGHGRGRGWRSRVRRVREVHGQKARVGGVEEAQPVAPRLDLEDGPAPPVHAHHVPEELGDPEGVRLGVDGPAADVRVGVRAVVPAQLAVDVERPVLEDQLDLLVARRQAERVVGLPGVELVAHQVEGGEAREDRDAGDPEHVVVKPQRRGRLGVRIPVDGRVLTRGGQGVEAAPANAVGREPGLRHAVEPRRDLRPVQVDDSRHRAHVGLERVPSVQGICPVEGLVDGEQLLYLGLVHTHRQVVDVGHRGRRPPPRLDRHARPGRRPVGDLVAPDPGLLERRRKDLLLELRHMGRERRRRDPLPRKGAQRRDVLRDVVARQWCLRRLDGRKDPRGGDERLLAGDEGDRAHGRACLDELPPGGCGLERMFSRGHRIDYPLHSLELVRRNAGAATPTDDHRLGKPNPAERDSVVSIARRHFDRLSENWGSSLVPSPATAATWKFQRPAGNSAALNACSFE